MCLWDIYVCLPAFFPCCEAMANLCGEAKTEAPVVTRFGLDDVQNDIQTKYVLTLVLEYEICAAGARVVKTTGQNQL